MRLSLCSVAVGALLLLSALCVAKADGEDITYTPVGSAVFLETEQACTPAPHSSDVPTLSCCGGLQCPYVNGVCCTGGTTCCPSGTQCLPTGPMVMPQCGTPSRDLCTCIGKPGCACGGKGSSTGHGKGSQPSGGFKTAGQDEGADVVWINGKPQRVRSRDGAGGAAPAPSAADSASAQIDASLTKVVRTAYPVGLVIDLGNLLYPYYSRNQDDVDLKLRMDIALNENLALQNVEIKNVSPQRFNTPGTLAEETAFLSKKPALLEVAAASSAKFSTISGVRVEAIAYCSDANHARALAHHIYMTFDGQNPTTFIFKALLALPPSSKGNAAYPFSVLPGSVVLLDGLQYSDKPGIDVGNKAKADVAEQNSRLTAFKNDMASLIKSVQDSALALKKKESDDAAAHAKLVAAQRARIAAERAAIVKKDEEDKKYVERINEEKSKFDAKDKAEEEKAKARDEADVKSRAQAVQQKAEEAKRLASLPVSLDYADNMRAFGEGYRLPEYTRSGNLCVLGGMIRSVGTNIRNTLAWLPRECRPQNRLIFDRHDAYLQTWRVEVFNTGKVAWNGGNTENTWASLDGMIMPTMGLNLTSISLKKGWVPYGSSFGEPSFFKEGDFCVLTGMVKVEEDDARYWTDDRNVIGQLPQECRPDARVVFSVNHHDISLRVDISSTGEIQYAAGKKTYKWLSLDGIQFFVSKDAAKSKPLELKNGYVAFDKGYRLPTVHQQDNLCGLSGTIEGTAAPLITIIPPECRPTRRLLFFVNRHTVSFRIDVKTNGEVYWVGTRIPGWIPLDGINWTVNPLQKWQIDLEASLVKTTQAEEQKAKADAKAEAAQKQQLQALVQQQQEQALKAQANSTSTKKF